MTILGDDAGTGFSPVSRAVAPVEATAGAVPRTAGRTTNEPASAAVTAEIPAVTPAWYEPSGSVRHRRPAARVPAPLPLRLGVTLLAIVLPFALIGLAVAQVQPSWLNSLRNNATHGTVVTAAHPPAATSGRLQVTGTSSTAVGYSVPSTSYSIVVSVAGDCWTLVKSPVSSTTYQLAQTLRAKDNPTTIKLTGTSSIEFFASTKSLAITIGGKKVGTIKSPKEAVLYTFRPASN